MSAPAWTAAELTARLRQAFADADVDLHDLTGTSDHWSLVIVSAAFAGKPPLQRQRLVYAALADGLTGPIHALTMTALAPGEPRPHTPHGGGHLPGRR